MTDAPAPARRVLIADPVAGVRGWLAAAAGVRSDDVTEVSQAWEVLWHLAHDPCELVILGPSPGGVPAVQLLAMVRTTGLRTPFIVVGPRSGTRRQLGALAPVEVVEDWSDWQSVRAARERVLRDAGARNERATPRDKLLDIAGRVAARTVAPPRAADD